MYYVELYFTDTCYSRKHSRICKLVKLTIALSRPQTFFSRKTWFLRPYWTCCCPTSGEIFSQENKT